MASIADLADALATEHHLPVPVGVTFEVDLAETMVRLRLQTSRRGGHAPPNEGPSQMNSLQGNRPQF